jgi:hypothetical protein
VTVHPRLFVTFTAPGFRQVHTPPHPATRCRAGHVTQGAVSARPPGCLLAPSPRGRDPHPRPACADCFDYQGLALWNALAPELWRRILGVTIYRT